MPTEQFRIETSFEHDMSAWVGLIKGMSSVLRYKVRRIIHCDPATIVFWQDGTKTVVKCMDGEKYDKYAGFCAALAKKIFGSTSKAKKVAGAKKKDEVAE